MAPSKKSLAEAGRAKLEEFRKAKASVNKTSQGPPPALAASSNAPQTPPPPPPTTTAVVPAASATSSDAAAAAGASLQALPTSPYSSHCAAPLLPTPTKSRPSHSAGLVPPASYVQEAPQPAPHITHPQPAAVAPHVPPPTHQQHTPAQQATPLAPPSQLPRSSAAPFSSASPTSVPTIALHQAPLQAQPQPSTQASPAAAPAPPPARPPAPFGSVAYASLLQQRRAQAAAAASNPAAPASTGTAPLQQGPHGSQPLLEQVQQAQAPAQQQQQQQQGAEPATQQAWGHPAATLPLAALAAPLAAPLPASNGRAHGLTNGLVPLPVGQAPSALPWQQQQQQQQQQQPPRTQQPTAQAALPPLPPAWNSLPPRADQHEGEQVAPPLQGCSAPPHHARTRSGGALPLAAASPLAAHAGAWGSSSTGDLAPLEQAGSKHPSSGALQALQTPLPPSSSSSAAPHSHAHSYMYSHLRPPHHPFPALHTPATFPSLGHGPASAMAAPAWASTSTLDGSSSIRSSSPQPPHAQAPHSGQDHGAPAGSQLHSPRVSVTSVQGSIHYHAHSDGLHPAQANHGSDAGSEAEGGAGSIGRRRSREEVPVAAHRHDAGPQARPPPPPPPPPSSFLDSYLSNLLRDEKPAPKQPQQATEPEVDPFEAAFYQEIGAPLPRASKKRASPVPQQQQPAGLLGRGWGDKGSTGSLRGLGGAEAPVPSRGGNAGGQRRGSASGEVANGAVEGGGVNGADSVDGHGAEGQVFAARMPRTGSSSSLHHGAQFSVLQQHIDDLAEEKLEMQRALTQQAKAQAVLQEENAVLARKLEDQDKAMVQLKKMAQRYEDELEAQALSLEAMSEERETARATMQESQERATALAAEVVGLESGLLQCKSSKLKADKQLEAKDQQIAKLEKQVGTLKQEQARLQEELGSMALDKRGLLVRLKQQEARFSRALDEAGASPVTKAKLAAASLPAPSPVDAATQCSLQAENQVGEGGGAEQGTAAAGGPRGCAGAGQEQQGGTDEHAEGRLQQRQQQQQQRQQRHLSPLEGLHVSKQLGQQSGLDAPPSLPPGTQAHPVPQAPASPQHGSHGSDGGAVSGAGAGAGAATAAGASQAQQQQQQRQQQQQVQRGNDTMSAWIAERAFNLFALDEVLKANPGAAPALEQLGRWLPAGPISAASPQGAMAEEEVRLLHSIHTLVAQCEARSAELQRSNLELRRQLADALQQLQAQAQAPTQQSPHPGDEQQQPQQQQQQEQPLTTEHGKEGPVSGALELKQAGLQAAHALQPLHGCERSSQGHLPSGQAQQQLPTITTGLAPEHLSQELSEIRPATPISVGPAPGGTSSSEDSGSSLYLAGGKAGAQEGSGRERKRGWLGFLFSPRRAQPASKKRMQNPLLQ